MKNDLITYYILRNMIIPEFSEFLLKGNIFFIKIVMNIYFPIIFYLLEGIFVDEFSKIYRDNRSKYRDRLLNC